MSWCGFPGLGDHRKTMSAIVMLTELSMGGASRTAADKVREHRKQGEPTPHTCESRGRREPQEMKTRTVRYQQPACTGTTRLDGMQSSFSSHAQTRPQTVGSGRDVSRSASARGRKPNKKPTKDNTSAMQDAGEMMGVGNGVHDLP